MMVGRMSSMLSFFLLRVVQGEPLTAIHCRTAGLPRSSGEVKAATFGAAAYNKHDRPSLSIRWDAISVGDDFAPEALPENVYVALSLLALVEVDAPSQTFTIDVMMRLIWNDPRMQFNSSCFQPDLFGGANFAISEAENMWSPNIFPDNLISSTILTQKAGVWIRSDGRVWWARQMRWVLSCSMDFAHFPFDTQYCRARLSDFVNDASSVAPLAPDGTEFVAGIDSVVLPSCHKRERGGTLEWVLSSLESSTPGSVSEAVVNTAVLDVNFRLTRRPDYWVLYVVTPLVLLVLLCYFSFFLSRAAPPARAAIPTISFLAIVGMMSSVLRSLPRPTGDVWLLQLFNISAYFVVASAVEYAAVAMLFRAEIRITRALNDVESKKDDEDVEGAEAKIENVHVRVNSGSRTLGHMHAEPAAVEIVGGACIAMACRSPAPARAGCLS